MYKIIIGILLLLVFNSKVIAQSITNKVIEYVSGESIPFVSIGFSKISYGVLSNEEGIFTLESNKFNDTLLVRFSSIGYESVFFTWKQLQELSLNAQEIVLKKKNIELNEVVIRDGAYEERIVGAKDVSKFSCKKPSLLQMNVDTTSTKNKKVQSVVGFEIGNKIKIDKGKQTFIDKVRFKTCMEQGVTTTYRINIYKEGKTIERKLTPIGMFKIVETKCILKKAIVIIVDGKSEVQEIDLYAQQLEVSDDFIVAIECLKSSNNKLNIALDLGIFGATDLLARESNMNEWVKAPLVDLTIVSATVTQKKEKSFFKKLF